MIAISYRREDSLPIAGRLYDRLQAKFGRQNVFMDFDSIPPGVDFREQIKQVIERSKLVIAVIGPSWLGEQNEALRRIDDPMDFVRLEIAYALKRGIPVIPVLINNAPMPKQEKLPPDIAALAFRNAVTLDTGIDFHHHADRLIAGICRLADVGEKPEGFPSDDKPRQAKSESVPQSKLVIVGAAILLVLITASAIWFLRERGRDHEPTGSKEMAASNVVPTASILPTPQASPSTLAIAEPTASVTTAPLVPTPAASEPIRSESASSPPPKTGKLFAGTWRGTIHMHIGDSIGDVDHQLTINENETEVRLGPSVPALKGWVHKGARTLTKTEGAGIYTIAASEDEKTATYTLIIKDSSGTKLREDRGIIYKENSTNKLPNLATSPTQSSKSEQIFAGTWEGKLIWRTPASQDGPANRIRVNIDATGTGGTWRYLDSPLAKFPPIPLSNLVESGPRTLSAGSYSFILNQNGKTATLRIKKDQLTGEATLHRTK